MGYERFSLSTINNKYLTLKESLTGAYSLSNAERASALLDLQPGTLGDRKPSELMDSMLALLGTNKPCFLFRQIFLRLLPDSVRTPLTALDLEHLERRALAQEGDPQVSRSGRTVRLPRRFR